MADILKSVRSWRRQYLFRGYVAIVSDALGADKLRLIRVKCASFRTALRDLSLSCSPLRQV